MKFTIIIGKVAQRYSCVPRCPQVPLVSPGASGITRCLWCPQVPLVSPVPLVSVVSAMFSCWSSKNLHEIWNSWSCHILFGTTVCWVVVVKDWLTKCPNWVVVWLVDLLLKPQLNVTFANRNPQQLAVLIRVETFEVESFFLLCFKEDKESNCGRTTELQLLSWYVYVHVFVCHCVRVFVQAVDGLTAVFGVVVASSLGILGPLISSGL